MDSTATLVTLLKEVDVVVGFSPLPDEADYRRFFVTNDISEPSEIIPPDQNTSPGELANKFVLKYADKNVAILIPGRLFDLLGTRYGRGGGWYDRFLSFVPRAWRRIGVLKESNINDEPLRRELWDEPVDCLLIDRGDRWEVETARKDSRDTV